MTREEKQAALAARRAAAKARRAVREAEAAARLAEHKAKEAKALAAALAETPYKAGELYERYPGQDTGRQVVVDAAGQRYEKPGCLNPRYPIASEELLAKVGFYFPGYM